MHARENTFRKMNRQVEHELSEFTQWHLTNEQQNSSHLYIHRLTPLSTPPSHLPHSSPSQPSPSHPLTLPLTLTPTLTLMTEAGTQQLLSKQVIAIDSTHANPTNVRVCQSTVYLTTTLALHAGGSARADQFDVRDTHGGAGH